MDSLANYGSDDEIDAPTSSNGVADMDTTSTNTGMEGDNYDDVQMEMSENPLNGSKAPSVQAHSLGSPGEAPPNNAINQLESGSESVNKDDDGHNSPHKSHQSNSSYSPASAASSNDSETDEEEEEGEGGRRGEEEEETSKPEETKPQLNPITSEKVEEDKCDTVIKKDTDQNKRDLDSRRDREKERERDRDKEKDRDRLRERDRDRDRGRDRDDRERRKDYRRDDRHRSRSRDRRDRHKSPVRTDKRRDERKKSRERRSNSREHRRRDSDRTRYPDGNRKDSDRKRHRSRSRSVDRHRPRNESRSSSSGGSSKSDARRDIKQSSGPVRGSRSRSKSIERDRARTSVADSRKFFLDKKIDRKMNVLERMGIELKAEAKPLIGTVTPQMLVQRTMEQEVAQVRQATGVELPSYYNAAAVNPQRLVDQIQKRKLLWGGRKDEASKTVAQPQANKWQGATFAQDQDGKLTAKFNRLMGIKQPVQAAPNPTAKEGGSEIIKKQEEMFHNMESQYEVARLATHTHRGLGLGFGTFQPR
ncbi:arginine/serine-rich coiled-coil protein 2 isoform X3 [Frankliniella occidentalis]|uniref:Arginine/serine-rich coiled-coil protein 2 isoform X3 n=1 Tax=Frankliniella occidentalis TaxID=133901 RepID=A0A9C6X425_FRAOC|nr:arginine/serine-rich coiled-coil protein 2 isoform X3 [Frankliniella occidentalis]